MGELLGRAVRTALWITVAASLSGVLHPLPAQDAGKKAPRAAGKAEPKAAPPKGEKAPAAKAPAEKAEGSEEPKAEGSGEAGTSTPRVAVPSADLWVLDFRFQRVATFQPTEGVRRGEVYWYLLYRIENKTGQDREAYISVTARSNKDKSYSNVFLPEVEPLIERKVGKPLWGKVDEVQALKERAEKGGITAEKRTFNYFKFKAGETRDCVAIFNKLDPSATSVTITVEGLSNDFHLLNREGGGRQIQSRIYQLELERPGDEYAMNLDRFRLKKQGWTKKLTELAVPKEG